MPLHDDVALTHSAYTLVSVGKTKTPRGTEGSNWYKYIVKRNDSTIVGCMRGTLAQVTNYARDFVEKLNVRSRTRPSYSKWSQPYNKQVKPKAAVTGSDYTV